jgi:hypothetical protein
LIIPKEYWVPIDGYEGWYEVSDQGRVRSVDRVVKFKNGKGSRAYKGQILKFRYHNGYAMVNLNKNKKMREHYVHRLVIENFTLHPKHKKWVNHKDGRKWNNKLSNLEWCTPKENSDHAIKHDLRNNNIEGLLASNNTRKKQVALIHYGEVVHLEPSALDMAKYLIKKEKITITNVDKVRYAIRYACQSGSLYQNMRFEYYKAS